MSEVERVGEALLRMSLEARSELLRYLSRRGMEYGAVFLKDESAAAAYDYGRKYGGSDYLRDLACQYAEMAYAYALAVDAGPHDRTREAASRLPLMALQYAENVDKGPHDETRRGACCGERYLAWRYAEVVDDCYHPWTWSELRRTQYAESYRHLRGFPEGK